MKKSTTILVSLGFITNGALAGTMGSVGSELPSRVVSLSLGPAWYESGENHTFFLTPEIEKSYVAHKSRRALAFGELFYGMQRQLSATWLGQLGLAGVVTSDAKVGGEIWDDASPEFITRNYQYSVNHARLTLKGKVLAQVNAQWLPYASGSLGLGFNRAHGYSTPPIIFEAVPDAPFASRTETSFVWTVGLGVERAVDANWRVGAGYEFADLGKSRLESAPGQTLNGGLTLNHLYTNALVLSAHYLR